MLMEQHDREFMDYSTKVAQDSNCRRRKVGAVIVLGELVVISAANGTPAGMTPCNEGGCKRCLLGAPSGESYDSCVCIHAEQSAIAQAARMGLHTEGATLYCTLRPCLTCLKVCLAAGIVDIIYNEDIQFQIDVEDTYKEFVLATGLKLTKYPENSNVVS